NRSYDEVNLSQPELVRDIHGAYLKAGAEVLTTNTFGANELRLSAYGLEDRVEDVNATAARLAREVARDRAWVAGSIGPCGGQLTPVGRVTPGEAFHAFQQQAAVLADSGVDVFVLETFTQVTELWQAVRAVRSVSDLPVICCMSFPMGTLGKNQVEGPNPEAAARTMSQWNVDAIGTNCSNGPRGVLEIIERISPHTHLPLVAMPNAGLPQIVEGRTLYLAAPEYMAEHARRLAQLGVRGIGGCCGTSPRMIREMRTFLKSVTPGLRGPTVIHEVEEERRSDAGEEPVPVSERTSFAEKLYGGHFCVSVELDPPKGVEPSRAVRGAHMLHNAGVDVVNIADGPRASARMGPAALSQLVRQLSPELETIVHYCCRDRNLLGMQMDLIGAHALGLRNILA
ncbi:MAG: homocysteine S-methyltransferase family protein, partial [Myxococcota bacterium]|nr:homocysteine S-methyltransferase family protein [Myxococcota bacterium]